MALDVSPCRPPILPCMRGKLARVPARTSSTGMLPNCPCRPSCACPGMASACEPKSAVSAQQHAGHRHAVAPAWQHGGLPLSYMWISCNARLQVVIQGPDVVIRCREGGDKLVGGHRCPARSSRGPVVHVQRQVGQCSHLLTSHCPSGVSFSGSVTEYEWGSWPRGADVGDMASCGTRCPATWLSRNSALIGAPPPY